MSPVVFGVNTLDVDFLIQITKNPARGSVVFSKDVGRLNQARFGGF